MSWQPWMELERDWWHYASLAITIILVAPVMLGILALAGWLVVRAVF